MLDVWEMCACMKSACSLLNCHEEGVIHGMSSIGLLDVTYESYTRLFTKENFCTEDVCSPVGQLE